MSAFDAKKAADEKKKRLQAEAKARAKAEKDRGKAERQKKRLEDIRLKSEVRKNERQRMHSDSLCR